MMHVNIEHDACPLNMMHVHRARCMSAVQVRRLLKRLRLFSVFTGVFVKVDKVRRRVLLM